MTELIEEFIQELKGDKINLPELDGKPCERCGLVPELLTKKVGRKTVRCRSNRMDCEAPGRKKKLVTYHIDCWKAEAKEDAEKAL
jgi:hypothetical protein